MEEWNDKKLMLTSVAICSCCGMFGIALGAFLFFVNICDSLEIPLLCETDCVSNCTNSIVKTLNNSVINTTSNTTWFNNSYMLNSTTNLSTNLSTNSTVNITIPDVTPNLTSDNFRNITSLYSRNVILPTPENNEITTSKMTSGEAIAISIACVFMFIGCVVGSAWYVIYKPNPIKKMVTNSTRSDPIPIKLTPDELELCQINPILKASDDNFFLKAVEIVKEAVRKDSEHYYPEAMELYNKGIDMFVRYMKTEQNGNRRFAVAKKVDVYLKRANYIQVHLMDTTKKLPKTPRPPIIQK
jgi:hypothetical protein